MAIVISVIALLVAGFAVWWSLDLRRKTAEQLATLAERSDDAAVPVDVQALRSEVSALRAELAAGLRHVAVVRYDAFTDMGGHLSWSCALLDDNGSGVLLTSIHGRQDTRTYAKGVRDWESPVQLSPEEESVIGHARKGAQRSAEQSGG